MKKLLAIFILFFTLCSYLQGQESTEMKRDTSKGFDFFINAGMYVGHSKNANYYRGVPDPLKSDYADPDIMYVLRNPFWRIEILNLIDRHNNHVVADTFWLEELSGMRYTTNLSFGIGARYRFTKNLSIGLVVTQARMTAHGTANLGIKIMEVNSANVMPYNLLGKERRNFFELSINYIFPTQGMVSPFLEADMHVSNTKVISSELIVEGRPFSLINWYGKGVIVDPGLSYLKENPRLGGVGYGFSAAVGLRISFNKWAAIEPVAQFRLEKINLAGYNDMTLNYNFMIRLVLGDGFFAKKR